MARLGLNSQTGDHVDTPAEHVDQRPQCRDANQACSRKEVVIIYKGIRMKGLIMVWAKE